MQVILLKDVPKVGKKGDLCQVSDGYGRNFLIARGFAEIASEGRLRAVAKEQAEHQAQLQREKEAAQAQAQRLEAKPLVLAVKCGDQEKLFGSVTSQDLASALQSQFQETVDKKNIKLDEPIRKLGQYKVQVRLHPQVKATLNVQVERS